MKCFCAEQLDIVIQEEFVVGANFHAVMEHAFLYMIFAMARTTVGMAFFLYEITSKFTKTQSQFFSTHENTEDAQKYLLSIKARFSGKFPVQRLLCLSLDAVIFRP